MPAEVEGILNHRLLMKWVDDTTEVATLTPNELHLLKSNEVVLAEVSENCPKRRWRNTQWLASYYWSQWLKDSLYAECNPQVTMPRLEHAGRRFSLNA
ncbi:hypothetical protein AHF37_00453 [Paragonimus kellicotti]|nr:hypothetical protein AHF37_00453 [Paragonimus kellicotti]